MKKKCKFALYLILKENEITFNNIYQQRTGMGI